MSTCPFIYIYVYIYIYIYKFYTYSGTPKVRLFFYIWQVSWQEKTIKRIAKLVQIKSTEASCKMAGVPNALQYFLLLHLHLIANSEWRAAAQPPARGAAAGGGPARGAAAATDGRCIAGGRPTGGRPFVDGKRLGQRSRAGSSALNLSHQFVLKSGKTESMGQFRHTTRKLDRRLKEEFLYTLFLRQVLLHI